MKASEILNGIRTSDRGTLNYIYKKYYKSIKRYIIQNSGSEDDANDIFQDGVMVIYQKIKKNELTELHCAFHTYLFSVCRFLWLQNLNKKEVKVDTDNHQIQESLSVEPDLKILTEETSRYDLYRKHFTQLNKECQKILNLFLQKTPQKKVAEMMGYKSVDYAKRKKYLCKEKLVEKIKRDPNFKEVMS
ncbi:MAG: RNA polymerase sigma factor [Bacteroidales bacterium]